MKTKAELLHCPFCGSYSAQTTQETPTAFIIVACNACGAQGPDRNNEQDAIQAWNLRVVKNAQCMDKDYLGDSVYAQHDGHHIILTTENGYPDDPRNKIALEPQVLDALYRYIARIKSKHAEQQPL